LTIRICSMRFLSIVIFVLLGLVILSGIGFFGYQFYQKLHAPVESPFKAIPQSAALIIKLNKPSHLWAESKQANQLWDDLFSVPYLAALKNQINFLDSVSRKNQNIALSLKNNPLFIILSPTVPSSYGLLFLINFPSSESDELLEKFINETWPSRTIIQKSSYAGSTIFRVLFKSFKNPFYFTSRNGIFIGSIQEMLVKQAIDRLSLNLASPDDQSFLQVTASSGKNVDANIFVNYERIAPFMAGITTHGKLSDYLNVSNFAAWSGLDIIQKKDNWLVSGYTVCKDSSYEYLSLFSSQSPQQFSMSSIIPGDASSFTWIGLSNPADYHQRLVSSKSSTSIYLSGYPNLMRIENDNQIHLDDYFLPWAGNEISLVTTFNSNPQSPNDVYGVFRVNDKTLADSLLQRLGNISSGRLITQAYKGHPIYILNIPDIIPGVWGNLFQRLNGSSCTFLADWLIFGNDPASLETYIDQVMSENVIDKNPDYRNFSENLSDEANLCYYINTKLAFSELQSILSESLNKEINPATDTLKKFESFGVQIINNGENFITNLFFHHNKAEQSKGPLAWQTALDTLVSGKPQIFMNALNGKPAIVAFDYSNTMYLLDWTGTIQWKLKIPGKPIGEVHEIRPGSTDSLYFLFNTGKHICVVDKNGLFAYSSPFFLPLHAVSGLAIYEFPSPGNYHIYLPLEDKKTYAFDVHGKQEAGWEKPSASEFPKKPLQLLNLRGKEFFFITSKNGQVLITDKRGKPIIKPRNKSGFSARSLFYLNKTNNKGDFITSSFDGKLLYLRTDGKISDLKFNNFTQDHLFFYADINNDKIEEFIFFDLNKIYCYNRFQKLLFDYTFPSQILTPFILNSPSGEILIGTVSPKSGDIYLFGKKGLLTIDPSIRGNTPFDISIIDPDQGTSLLIGAGKYIKNWLLPK
jgi:hypothetical protein